MATSQAMISVDSEDFARVMRTYSTQQVRINELMQEVSKQVQRNRFVDWTQEVRSLCHAYQQDVPERPAWPNPEVLAMRVNLMDEEFDETVNAIEDGDFPAFIDGCIDLIVVTIGAMTACGVDPRPIWAEIMKTNFAKLHGPVREDGKKLKPIGWVPPDIVAELKKQGWVPPSE